MPSFAIIPIFVQYFDQISIIPLYSSEYCLNFPLTTIPGVDFKVIDIVSADGESYSQYDDSYTANISVVLKPAYKLIDDLERDWPVSIKFQDVPYVLTKGMYNSITLAGSAILATSFLLVASILLQIFTFRYIFI